MSTVLSGNRHRQSHLNFPPASELNALGHILTPLLSVEGCYLRLFPAESHSLKVFLDDASPVCPCPAWSLLEPWNLQAKCFLCCSFLWHHSKHYIGRFQGSQGEQAGQGQTREALKLITHHIKMCPAWMNQFKECKYSPSSNPCGSCGCRPFCGSF